MNLALLSPALIQSFPSLTRFMPRVIGQGSWTPHIGFGYDLVAALRPACVVELGVDRGESFFAFCESMDNHGIGGRCAGVDLWEGDRHALRYDDAVFREVKRVAERHYTGMAQLMRMDFDAAAAQFAPGSVDLLHIDGLHTYEAVRHDFETWRNRLAPGGVMLIHDVNVRRGDFGVWRFWDEIRSQGDAFVLQNGPGLGVWRPREGGAVPDFLRMLFEADEERAAWLAHFYEVSAERLLHVMQPEGHPPVFERPVSTVVQVFVPDNKGHYQAGEAVSQRVSEKGLQEVRLFPERRFGSGRVRIDFEAPPCQIRVQRIEIRNRDAQDALLWRASLAKHFYRIETSQDCCPSGAGPAYELLLFGEDPQLLLPKLTLPEPTAISVLIEFSAPTTQWEAARSLRDGVRAIALSASRDWRLLSHARNQLHEVAEQLSGLRSSDLLRDVELRETLTALDIARTEVSELRRELDASEGRLRSMRRSWSWRSTIWMRVIERSVTAAVRWMGGRRKALLEPLVDPDPPTFSREQDPGVRVPRIISFGWLDAPVRYEDWIERTEPRHASERTALRSAVQRLPEKPLFSVIMPVCDPPLELLRAAIDSVKAQVYPHWELCIADDASGDPAIREHLREMAHRDGRIRLTRLPQRGHISRASNAALELANGDFIALLDHDDLLAPHALYVAAEAICAHPRAALLYSDEDKIDETGRRFEPYFKPDWNYDLFLSQNCISHLGIYRTATVRQAGGFREGLEGSQDYDLALRVIELIEPEAIVHLPFVLYHWRVTVGSTASGIEAKPYATDAARRAIIEHLQRTGVPADVVANDENPQFQRIKYGLPPDLPAVTAIIPNRDQPDLLRTLLVGLREKTDYPGLRILVVDNGSQDPQALGLLAGVRNHPDDRVVTLDRPFNFSELINAGVAAAESELVLLLNNDIEVTEPGWLREMVSHAIRVNVGAVGARLWYPSGEVQHGGVILGAGGIAAHAHANLARGEYGYFARAILTQNFSAVTAACLLTHRRYFKRVGGFDAVHLPVAFNDVDFCLKLRSLGLRIVWTPYANLVHHESKSRGRDESREKLERFHSEIELMMSRYPDLLASDPAYNPNLSLIEPSFLPCGAPRHPIAWRHRA